jgi:hypothetical protein
MENPIRIIAFFAINPKHLSRDYILNKVVHTLRAYTTLIKPLYGTLSVRHNNTMIVLKTCVLVNLLHQSKYSIIQISQLYLLSHP